MKPRITAKYLICALTGQHDLMRMADFFTEEDQNDNQVIELTKSEFDIVAFLSRHPGQVFDREMIYEKLWGLDRDGDNKNVTELIRRIRNKIREHTDREFIETVWGCGYRWAAK